MLSVKVNHKSSKDTMLFCILIMITSSNVLCQTKVRKFPKGFKFGASTSAYQIEGAWNKEGKGPSIWDIATHTNPSPVKNGDTGDVTADSYHQYKRDVEIMKELGLHFYRFSVSWPRILPNGFSENINPSGIEYYNNLINELLRNNIEPVITLYHWDLPQNLQKLGGWLNPYVIRWFTDYARIVFDNFGDKVKRWITINEPKQICYEGYGSDIKAPMINASGIGDYMCVKNVLLAHAAVYHLYDNIYRTLQNGTIGIVISCKWFEPVSNSLHDEQAAIDARQFDWGFYAHPIFTKTGDFPVEVKQSIASKSAEQGFSKSRLPELTTQEITLIRGSSDFLGVNSYTTSMVYRDASVEGMYPVPSYMDDIGAVFQKEDEWIQAVSPWLLEVPWGFYKIFMEIKNLYNNPPVIVFENGWSTAGGLIDDDRIRYIRKYLNALLDAIDDGCNIKGYMVWTLMDNFEWMAGFSERFGLYEVDFKCPTKERTPRKSAYVYKEIIRSHSLDPNYEPSDMSEMGDE